MERKEESPQRIKFLRLRPRALVKLREMCQRSRCVEIGLSTPRYSQLRPDIHICRKSNIALNRYAVGSWLQLLKEVSKILCCSSRRLTGCLAEKVARDVDDSKTSAFLRMRLKISLYKNLDSLIAGMHFHAHRRVPKINFVSATIPPSDNRMCHLCTTRSLDIVLV
jgi:hypothetical protein